MKSFKPYTPSRRFITVEDFSSLTKKDPREKASRAACARKAGRNNFGLLVVRHQGGGHKRAYRMIDFKRNKFGVPGKVAAFGIRSEPQRAASPSFFMPTEKSATSFSPKA